MSELLPCPFCGGEAVATEKGIEHKIWYAGCISKNMNCCARTMGFTEEQAIAAWNTRAERTCHYEYENVTPLLGEGTYRIRRCSECTQALKPVWNYCPECGARVVSE